MNVNLGGKIRQLRKNKDISQEVLAQALCMSFQAVSKWETGGPKLKDTTLKPTLTLLPNNIILEVLGQRSLWVHPRVTFLCSTL